MPCKDRTLFSQIKESNVKFHEPWVKLTIQSYNKVQKFKGISCGFAHAQVFVVQENRFKLKYLTTGTVNLKTSFNVLRCKL